MIFFQKCSESAAVDTECVTDYMYTIPGIICRYSPQSVLNFYKTGLLSDKKLAELGKEYKGRKLPKERLNVMMCCSSTREKRIPLVIGKAWKLHSIQQNFPLFGGSNKKSWTTGETFKDWVIDVNKEMKKTPENVTSHSHDLQLNNITLKYFPPNTTSKLQPLDLGMINFNAVSPKMTFYQCLYSWTNSLLLLTLATLTWYTVLSLWQRKF